MTKQGKKFNVIKRKPHSFRLDDGNGGGGGAPPPPPDPDLLPPPEPAETRSVLGEILEGFGEIAYSFNGLGIAFKNFGDVIETEAGNLGTQMKKSVDNITVDVSNVVFRFGEMGKNLADNFERD